MSKTSPARLGVITEQEIASQPSMWSRVLTDERIDLGRLPKAGEPVLVVGCGTSYYIGEAWARLRVAAGLGPTRAAIASELDRAGDGETVILISRSGTTTDVERVGRRLRDAHRVVAIVGTPDTPIEQVSHDHLLLDFADERSVMQTRFATTTLALLRRAIAESTGHLVGEAERALESPLPLGLHDHLVFLGRGWTVGIAHEAALKCLEASGCWAEAHPIREYQHGPIAAADARTLVWSLTHPEPELRRAVAATGARLHEASFDPMAELILAQRTAVELARRAGRDPDRPEHLSRSVVDE